MEYAGDTLKSYLKEHFENLTWNDKLNLALQLARAVLCLHDENIVRCDLVIFLCYVYYVMSIINYFIFE